MALLRNAAGTVVVGLCLSGTTAVVQPLCASQSAAVSEDDVKAAFLYNFAKYVAWPPAAASQSFRLCVVADAGFIKRIDNLIAGETIEGRPVMRETPATGEAARACQILFVGASESARASRLIVSVKGTPVLTVGDTDDFLTRGGMIAFVRDGDRVRFDVNNAAAQGAGLSVSSRLLRLARHVGVQEQGP
jgi:hypothetical protein